jgi:NAD(P)-dependent dehydrogenase (short-subunit alcohol dehydrogenase family)
MAYARRTARCGCGWRKGEALGDDRYGAPRFADQVAVVSGSTSDPSIGRSCAFRLAREGAAVVVNGRSAAAVTATVEEMAGDGLRAVGVSGPAEDEGVAASMVAAAIDAFGRIDLVVNTVGGAAHQGTVLTMDRASYLDTLAINTWPAVALVQAAMHAGLADGGGAVVFISSNTVNMTTPAMIAYKSGKAALNALTTTLARDLGPQGVRVNGVAPGLTMTTATRPFWEADGGSGAGSQLVLGRLPRADDIANVTAFLLSSDAAMVTGTTIDVDAGTSLIVGWSPFMTQPTRGE